MRALSRLHRCLGIATGLLMALWCLSGIVMVYVPYPVYSSSERHARLQPLQLQDCCALERIALPADTVLEAWRIEMLAGEPVLRIVPLLRPEGVTAAPEFYRLRSGERAMGVDASTAMRVAREHAASLGLATVPRLLGLIDRDQWTVQGSRGRAPLYHFALDDPQGVEVYVSSASGEVVQETRRRERFWNWLGSVPHWLYPTVLRAHVGLWSQIVIATSLLGLFLTVAGLVLGVMRWRQRRRGSWSPFRGLWSWHHGAGLVFGVLLLLWVSSGLLSMNPWGLLESEAGGDEAIRLQGDLRWGETRTAIERLVSRLPARPPLVEVRSAPLAGRLHLVLTDGRGTARRVDARIAPAPLSTDALHPALALLGPALQDLRLLETADDYYYPHHDAGRLPVWRAQLGDAGQTRLYLDPVSGGLLRAIDAPLRSYRWLHYGLHRWDFAWLRGSPGRDLLLWLLLGGASALSLSGCLMGWRRLRAGR